MSQYGICQSWVDATKMFGRHLMKMPEDQPVELWPLADYLMQHHNDWAKTLIKDFINHDAVTVVEKADHFEANKYAISKEVIDELGWM